MLRGAKNIQLHDLATTGGLSIEDAFQKVYTPKDKKTLMTLLAAKKKREPELFKKITDFKAKLFDKATQAQVKAIEKHATNTVLSLIEKRELLTKIITGDVITEEMIVVDKKLMREKRGPSLREVMTAIEVDNKMAGHIAPTTLKHEGGDSFLEFMAGVASLKKNNAK